MRMPDVVGTGPGFAGLGSGGGDAMRLERNVLVAGLVGFVVALVVAYSLGMGGESGTDLAAEAMDDAAPAAYVPPAFTPESRELDQADIERLMDELSNWGRWGPDDQLGAANLITPEKRLEALALATEGITVSLAHRVLKDEADDVPLPFGHRMLGVPDAAAASAFFGGVSDNYQVSYHGYSHSHIDSLCHILHKGQMYNGVSQDTITEAGCSNASIVNLQGGIVTRGVLARRPAPEGGAVPRAGDADLHGGPRRLGGDGGSHGAAGRRRSSSVPAAGRGAPRSVRGRSPRTRRGCTPRPCRGSSRATSRSSAATRPSTSCRRWSTGCACRCTC